MFPKALRLEVIGLLCLKALGLTILYLLFFAPHPTPEPNGKATATHIFSSKAE